jgi:hypothetical protein
MVRTMPNIALQPVEVETASPDAEGLLAFADGRLVAVLVRLSAELHEAVGLEGHWSVEAGFGPCILRTPAVVLPSTEAVCDWVKGRVNESRAA